MSPTGPFRGEDSGHPPDRCLYRGRDLPSIRATARGPKVTSMSMTEPYDEIDDDENEEVQETAAKQERDARAQQRISEKRDAAVAEAKAAKKELLFVKAGVDTDSKLGKLLLNSYDGDLTVEAVKAEAVEVGALAAVAEVPKGPEITEAEAQSTDARQELALGAQAETLEDPDPYGTAIGIGKAAINDGANEMSAIGLAFRHVAQDQRNWQS